MPQRNKPAPGRVGDALWLREEEWKEGDPTYLVLKVSETNAKLLYSVGTPKFSLPSSGSDIRIGPDSWWDEITVAGRWEVPDGEAEEG